MSKRAKLLMFQGTGSDVGKSLLVAGLCRAYKRRGLIVRPFKPQNMSNNAAVTNEGGEIGRAQALQARACGCQPCNDMNPILLKPQSQVGAQIVVQGKIWGKANARDYQQLKRQFLPAVLESCERLRAQADLVLIEGAGSAAEVNLRENDIANMGFAMAANCPVILIGDIDRGGVLASLAGTYTLLPPEERALLKGYIINKFRGDPALFGSAPAILAQHGVAPNFGLVPYFDQARQLPAEDAVSLFEQKEQDSSDKPLILVLKLPHIANFDDFDPLLAEQSIRLRFHPIDAPLPADCKLLIIPGSKATISDLEALHRQGWLHELHCFLRRGGRVLGICGGYQMLGNSVHDPEKRESETSALAGFGLLDISTTLAHDKTLRTLSAESLHFGKKAQLSVGQNSNAQDIAPVHIDGYEIHIGRSQGKDCQRPFARRITSPDHSTTDLQQNFDGAINPEGTVFGTYLHGLFSNDRFRASFLEDLNFTATQGLSYEQQIEDCLDALADHLEQHLDLDAILASARD